MTRFYTICRSPAKEWMQAVHVKRVMCSLTVLWRSYMAQTKTMILLVISTVLLPSVGMAASVVYLYLTERSVNRSCWRLPMQLVKEAWERGLLSAVRYGSNGARGDGGWVCCVLHRIELEQPTWLVSSCRGLLVHPVFPIRQAVVHPKFSKSVDLRLCWIDMEFWCLDW